MTAVIGCMACSAVYAAPATPNANEIVTTGEEFLNATTANIFFDGNGTSEVTVNISQPAGLYVRDGELKFTTAEGSSTPNVKLGNFVVSGNNAVMTFDNANYSSNAALNHVGGVDGNGTLNITNSEFDSDAEVFTIGVNGNQAGNGSDGSSYGDGAYADNGYGSGTVNITDSTAKLTYRHLQIGEGSLNINNSTVTVGNYNSSNDYYKGFKTSLGVGENSNSTIKVSNGGELVICAAPYTNDKGTRYYGGLSTNYSDGSTSNIIVDGGTLTVKNPENADSEKYPEGINGTAYIGYSFNGETENATANIVISNGGTVNFDNHTTNLGYENMVAAGTKVNVTVADSSSSLNISSHDFHMHDGATLNNSGTVVIDTNYVTNIMANGEPNKAANTTYIKGGQIINNAGGKIEVVNELELQNNSSVTNNGTISASEIILNGEATLTNSGTISESEITLNGDATLTNSGTIKSDGWFTLADAAQATNSGTIDSRIWMVENSSLTLETGSETLKLLYVGYESTLNIDGDVSMKGGLNTAYATAAEIVFTLGSSIDLGGNALTLNPDLITLVLVVDGTVDENTTVTAQSLFTNYDEDNSTISDSTLVYLRGSDGSQVTTTLGAITVPEPTTATLSLLALAALTARRRRK